MTPTRPQPGGLPPDVFHPGEHEPYTGWRDVGDYVENIQLAQMQILGDMGTDIMWCDVRRLAPPSSIAPRLTLPRALQIGGANHSSVRNRLFPSLPRAAF